MEIKFENKMLGTYRELSHQIKRVQETTEAVVPDTKEDIAKIASVNTEVLLKSKDVNGRGVKITGEACAVLLYICEAEDKISALNIKKAFEIEYEIGDIDAESLPQIKLSISNSEARILNPRKVSLSFEITGELSCYKPETVSIDSDLPAEYKNSLHTKTLSSELMLAQNISEKSFAVNEQFTFPREKPVPRELVFGNPDFIIEESQHIGSKIIVKGSLQLDCCYLSDEVNYPLRTRFTSSFSQIIDSGEEDIESLSTVIQLSAEYYELIENINGDKALDAELHAVIQYMSCSKKTVKYISDAYCNAMPGLCKMKSFQINEANETYDMEINKQEQINLSQDCSDINSAFAAISQLSLNKGKITAIINLDIIYASKDGNLASARRILNVEEDTADEACRIVKAKIKEIDLRPQGETADCSLKLQFTLQSYTHKELNRVEELELLEEKAYDTSKFPSLSMVRQGDDNIWELAKNYHSSVESIEFMNPGLNEAANDMILIPKEI